MSPALCLKAAGNAYPVPLMIAQLVPLINSIAICGTLKPLGPQEPLQAPVTFSDRMSCLKAAIKAAGQDATLMSLAPSPPKKAMKAMKAKKKAKAKATPRALKACIYPPSSTPRASNFFDDQGFGNW